MDYICLEAIQKKISFEITAQAVNHILYSNCLKLIDYTHLSLKCVTYANEKDRFFKKKSSDLAK